jgi:glycosyltransferase involved in cell wall biosynthesis
MKIAILAHSVYSLNEPFAGGLEMITRLLVERLIARGYDVTLYAHPETDVAAKLIPVDVTSAGLTENDVAMLKKGNQSIVDIAFAKAVKHIAQQDYDLIHNHSLNCAALAYLSFAKIPVVHTFHTPIIPSVLGGVTILTGRENITFTTVSKFMKHEWETRVDQVEVVYNGIEVESWPYEAAPSGDYLFWYGRLCEEKSPHHAIIAAINTDTKLVLAGPRYDQEYYEMYVEPYLENQFVEYVGHLEHEEIKVYLSNAKACLFTSLWNEPYGLVLAESLSCGTPVLAYDAGASIEIINDSCGVVVEKGQVDELMAAIPEVMAKERSLCRARAENFCSAERMVDGYISIYENILQEQEHKAFAI